MAWFFLFSSTISPSLKQEKEIGAKAKKAAKKKAQKVSTNSHVVLIELLIKEHPFCSKQAKKKAGGTRSNQGDAGQSGEPPIAAAAAEEKAEDEGERTGQADCAYATAALLSTLRHAVIGTPSAAAAMETEVHCGPHVQVPLIIRPVIVRPVVAAAAAGSAAAPLAPAATTEPPRSPAPYMSAFAAVQRVRRMLAESNERKKEEQENECVICLDRPMSTVLQPCGHVQMCSRCCREHLALAESKSVEPQVREA